MLRLLVGKQIYDKTIDSKMVVDFSGMEEEASIQFYSSGRLVCALIFKNEWEVVKMLKKVKEAGK